MVRDCEGVSTMVARRVTHRSNGTSSHHRGSSVSRMRPYTTPPYMFFDPGNGPRSTSATDRPARARTSAADEPAGPAPTTTASNDVDEVTVGPSDERSRPVRPVGHERQAGRQLVEEGDRVGDDRQIGHGHEGG